MRCAVLLILFSVYGCLGHIRLTYPPPRSTDPGIKGPYPCGPDAFWGPGQNTTDVAPGPLLVRWEETINHDGTPFRFALSPNDDTNYNNYVLVDHLPHNDLAVASKFYAFTLTIPNIDCPRCSLQIFNPMTAACCTYPNNPTGTEPAKCVAVYHTCANIRILGTIPISQYTHTYTGPCGAYMTNSATWVVNGTDYVLANPDYIPGIQNTCPGWQRSCSTQISTPTPSVSTPSPSPSPSVPAPSSPPKPPAPIDLSARGFNNKAALVPEGGLDIYWITPSPNANKVTFALRASTNGWLAVGWTGGLYKMVGSDAVIGEVDNGVARLMFYNISGTIINQITPAPVPLYDNEGEYVAGVTTFIFTRDTTTGKFPININKDTLIGAIGGTPTFLGQHTIKSTQPILVDYVTGQSSVLPMGLYDFHAVLMTLSWGFIMPIAVIFARYFKHLPNAMWFTVHQIMQIVGYILAVIGFFVALGMVQGAHFKTVWHAQFGMFVLVWGFLQLLAGILRPEKEYEDQKKTYARAVFEIVHPWSGRLLLFFSLIQIFGGMAVRNSPGGWVAFFVILIVLMIAGVVFLEIRLRRSNGTTGRLE